MKKIVIFERINAITYFDDFYSNTFVWQETSRTMTYLTSI